MMSLSSKVRLAIGIALITVGTVGGSANWILSHRSSVRPEDVRTKLSPNSAFKATFVMYAGGGGPAGFCYGYITIVALDAPDTAALNLSNSVLSYPDCMSVGAYAGAEDWSPMIDWLSDTDVKITIKTGYRQPGKQVEMKSSDSSRKVHVTIEDRRK